MEIYLYVARLRIVSDGVSLRMCALAIYIDEVEPSTVKKNDIDLSVPTQITLSVSKLNAHVAVVSQSHRLKSPLGSKTVQRTLMRINVESRISL